MRDLVRMRMGRILSGVWGSDNKIPEKYTRKAESDEIANNPGRYPTLAGKNRFVIRIISVLVHHPGISVMACESR
jgi:hypothetical protein